MAYRASDNELDEYRQFLASQPHPYITQSMSWPEVKKGWDVARYIERDDNGTICGVAQVLSIRDQKTGHGLAYVPRGPVVTGDDLEVVTSLISQVISDAKEAGAATVRVDPCWVETEETIAKLNKLGDLADSVVTTADERLKGQPKLSMILDLEGYTPESWFEAIKKNKRRDIRRSGREGVVVEVRTDKATIEDLFQLIEQTAERQGISYRPKQYFYDLYDAFSDDTYFTVASLDGDILSISMNTIFGGTVYNLYGGNSLSHPKALAPAAMNAEIVYEAFRRGLTRVDFGGVFGTDSSDHLYRFKQGYFPADQDVTIYAGEIDFSLEGDNVRTQL